MGDDRVKGAKSIVPYMRRFVTLHSEQDEAWRTLKRWKKHKGFPIEYAPNGEPFIVESKFIVWWKLHSAGFSKGGTRGDYPVLAENGQ